MPQCVLKKIINPAHELDDEVNKMARLIQAARRSQYKWLYDRLGSSEDSLALPGYILNGKRKYCFAYVYSLSGKGGKSLAME